MSVIEILTEIQSLSHSDKLQILQRLATDIAREEGVSPLDAAVDFPIWSPHDAYGAAEVLLNALDTEPSVDG